MTSIQEVHLIGRTTTAGTDKAAGEETEAEVGMEAGVGRRTQCQATSTGV